MKKDKRLYLRLSEKESKKIKCVSEWTNITLSQTIRKAIDEMYKQCCDGKQKELKEQVT